MTKPTSDLPHKVEQPSKPKFSIATLKTRIASALVMVPTALAAVYFGGATFSLLIAVAGLVMVFEWARMVDGTQLSFSFYALGIAGLVAFALAGTGYYVNAYMVISVGGMAAWLSGIGKKRGGYWHGLGALYILVPSIALIWLRNEPAYGRSLTFILFFVVWATDSGAYVFGKWLGGPKLNPQVSPKKTWSGTLGGILTGACIAAFAAFYRFGSPTAAYFFLLGAALAVASVVGDLAESAAKRSFGVKDSSGFIPGHGGVLDRLDGMLFATLAMTGPLYLFAVFDFVMGR